MAQDYRYGITITADGTSSAKIDELADAITRLNNALGLTPGGSKGVVAVAKAAGEVQKEAQKGENAVTAIKEKGEQDRLTIGTKADAEERARATSHSNKLEQIEREKESKKTAIQSAGEAKRLAQSEAAERKRQASAQRKADKQGADDAGRRRLHEEVLYRRDLEFHATGKSQGPRGESFESWDANDRKNQLSKRAASSEVLAPGPATSVLKSLRQSENEIRARQAMNYEVLMKPSEQRKKVSEGVIQYQQFPGQNIPAYGPQATDLAKGRAAWQKANPILGPGNDAGVVAWEKQKQSQAKQLSDAWGKAIDATSKMLDAVTKKANATGVKMARAEAAIDPRLFAEKAKRARGATAMTDEAALKDLFAVLTPQSGAVGQYVAPTNNKVSAQLARAQAAIDDRASAGLVEFNNQFESANKPGRTVHPEVERMFGGVAARLTGTDPVPAAKGYKHYDAKALGAELAKKGMIPDTRLLPNIPEMGIWHQQANEKNEKITRDRDFGRNAKMGPASQAFVGSIQQAASRVNLFSVGMRAFGMKTAGTGTTLISSLQGLSKNAAQFSGALHAQQDKFRALHYLGGSMVQQGMVMGAAGAGMVGGGMYLANEAGTFEQRKRGMTALIGQDSTGFVDAIKAFDRRSPVSNFNQSMEAAQQLLGSGFKQDEIVPLLDRIGDAVAGTGGGMDNFGAIITQLRQAKAGAKFNQRDITAMATSGGIPITAILEAGLGAARMKQVHEGDTLTGDEAIKGFMDGVYKYRQGKDGKGVLEGAMARNVDTLPGQLSNLTSAFQQMAIAIGERILPFVKWVTGQLIGLFDWITKIANTPVIGHLIGLFAGLGMVIGGLMVVLSPVVIGLGYMAQAVAGLDVATKAWAATVAWTSKVTAAAGVSTLVMAGYLAILAGAAYICYQAIGWTNDALTMSEANWRNLHPHLAAFSDWMEELRQKLSKITNLLKGNGWIRDDEINAENDDTIMRDRHHFEMERRRKFGHAGADESFESWSAKAKKADEVGGGKSGGDTVDAPGLSSMPAGMPNMAEALKDLNKEIAAQTADFKTAGLTNLPTTGASEPFSQERYDLERAAMGGNKEDAKKLRELKLDDKYEAHGEKEAKQAQRDAERESMIKAYRATGNEPAALALEGERDEAILERKRLQNAKRAESQANKAATQQKMAVLQEQINAEQLRHHDEVARIRAMHSMRAKSRQKLMDTENRAHMVKMQAFAAERRAINTGMDFFRKAVAAMNAAMAPMQRDPRVQTARQKRMMELPDYAFGATGGSRPGFDMTAWTAQKGENDAQWAAYRAKQAADKKAAADKATDAKKFAPLRGLPRTYDPAMNLADSWSGMGFGNQQGGMKPSALSLSQMNGGQTQFDGMSKPVRVGQPVYGRNSAGEITVQFPPVVIPASNQAKRQFSR